MSKEKDNKNNSNYFFKHGQTKIYKNQEDGLLKLADCVQKEYGIDDLVEDSKKEGGENGNHSSDQ